jgi:hypothetical protein
MKHTKPRDHDFNVHAQARALIGAPYPLCAGMVTAAHSAFALLTAKPPPATPPPQGMPG